MTGIYEIIDEFDLVGIPFEWGGRDHTVELDCYGLVKFLHAQRGNILPEYITPEPKFSKRFVSESAHEEEYWKKVDDPDVEGRVIIFRTCEYLHVGYALGDGSFIHTWEKSGGVCIEPISQWKSRIEDIYEFIGR